jgi:hypothetical protein
MVIRGDSVGGASLFFSRFLFTGVPILAVKAGYWLFPKPSQATWRGDWLTP